MSRNLTELVRQAAGAKCLAPAFLCQMDFASGPVRVWSGAGNLVWNGNTFLGVGSYGGVTSVEETKSTSANGIELSLSGVPSSAISMALLEQYRNRRIFLWLALFDTTVANAVYDARQPPPLVMLDAPIQIFGGRMDTMRISDTGDTSQIVVACESRLIDMERARERRYTDADQKELYPNDRGFEFVASLPDKNIVWGRKVG